MRIVGILALFSGVSALQRPSSADIMRMTLKSRSFSDVSLEMEAQDNWDGVAQEHVAGAKKEKQKVDHFEEWDVMEADGSDYDNDDSNPGKTTVAEVEVARLAFVGFALCAAAIVVGAYQYIKRCASVEAGDFSESAERGPAIYVKVAPTVMICMAVIMYFSVVGSIMAINKKIYNVPPKTNVPGYEGRKVGYERIDNPGERAFFASFALVAQATIGLMICMYLRKSQQVQITTSLLLKMACRGAFVGVLGTLSVEFIRLPFHDYMLNEDQTHGRVFAVLGWVGFVALMEECFKISCVAIGLKRDDTAAGRGPFGYIAESPQAIALCGLAAGMGFAFIENIPRMYALACQKPLAEIVSDGGWGMSQRFVYDEGTLRGGRIWSFIFWGIFNLQPWLTGIAAMKVAKITGKAPVAPLEWFGILWFVVMVHFFFDLLDRSQHPLVEFMGCCAIPYAMYHFKKQWESFSTSDSGLLEDRE